MDRLVDVLCRSLGEMPRAEGWTGYHQSHPAIVRRSHRGGTCLYICIAAKTQYKVQQTDTYKSVSTVLIFIAYDDALQLAVCFV